MPNEKKVHYAVSINIPLKRGGFSQVVPDLSESNKGDVDTYDPVELSEKAISLLIDYINHKTKRGGYYRNVGDSHLKRMAERFASSLQSFSIDAAQREVVLTQKLYDDKGIEDEVRFEFKRCELASSK